MNKTKETILNEVTGWGHFEPLGHYAEVHLKIEPAERNNGIIFKNLCHADDLTTGNQNLVRTHIFEREHHDILTSSPITDIKITLLTGRGPVATFMDYSMEFIPLTKGKGK